MGAYGNYKLCAYWNDNYIQDEEDMEEFVYILSKEKASPQEFENLFKYLGEYKMWEDEIAKADDYERHADFHKLRVLWKTEKIDTECHYGYCGYAHKYPPVVA